METLQILIVFHDLFLVVFSMDVYLSYNSEFSDIVWLKIIEFEKELVLRRNKVLNTKSNKELAEMLFAKIKNQTDLTSINLKKCYPDIGIEDFLKLPQPTHERLDKIGNMVWQKVKELKKQRKLI